MEETTKNKEQKDDALTAAYMFGRYDGQKEVEAEEHDPENFPEVPAAAPESVPMAETPAVAEPVSSEASPAVEAPVAPAAEAPKQPTEPSA